MTRYTFEKALPLPGAAAALLTAAVECPYPTTLAELAKVAGISKFAASRAAQTLMQADLLHLDPRGYTFNPDHSLAETVERLVWRFSGVRRHELDADQHSTWHTWAPPEDDHYYRQLIPKSLQLGATIPADSLAGPGLVTVRDTCDRLAQLSRQLREFHSEAQAVYSLWWNERARDLIHQTVHLPGGLAAAHHTLEAAAGSDAQGDGNPFEVPVSAHAWIRATYLVSAEAWDVLGLITMLDQSIWVGHRVHQRRSDALRALNAINYSGTDGSSIQHHLAEALKAEKEADQLWDDPTYGRWHHVGGTPVPQDVGTAGDQVIAVRLLCKAQALSAQVAAMSEAPCVQEWVTANPGQAATRPLMVHVPDDALRGQRDWPAWAPGSEV